MEPEESPESCPRPEIVDAELRYRSAFVSGLIAGALLTVIAGIGRSSGVSKFDFELLLGSLLTGNLAPSSWMVGLLIHLIGCGAVGVLYLIFFQVLGSPGVILGIGLGFCHALVAGFGVGLLGILHPKIPDQLHAPGYFAVNFGAATVGGFFLAHLIFGGVMGMMLSGLPRMRAYRQARRLAREENEEIPEEMESA